MLEVTSVSVRETKTFEYALGICSYQKIKPEFFFGYQNKEFNKICTVKFATPEKAILDFLYLYSFYKTPKDMLELRFDEYFMAENLDREKLIEYADAYGNSSLKQRLTTLLSIYS